MGGGGFPMSQGELAKVLGKWGKNDDSEKKKIRREGGVHPQDAAKKRRTLFTKGRLLTIETPQILLSVLQWWPRV